MDFLNDANNKNNNQYEATNKLLLEMVKNQKQNIKNLIRVFVFIIICYTALLMTMIIGFFVYESQFEVTSWETVTTQNADSEGDGVAIVNNNGDWNYGESESDNNN